MDPIDDNLSEGETELKQELANWLPRTGDCLFIASFGGANLDPLGLTSHGEPRKLAGRWRLYAGGFLAAADRLVDSCKGLALEDELIYPILALYRHHLELLLKYVLSACPEGTEELKRWLTTKHGLKELWNKLGCVYPRFSVWSSSDCTRSCELLVEEFDRHDPSSQGSRYPVDKKGNQTLTDLHSIDLGILKLGIHKISHYLWTVVEQIGEDREWEAEMASW